MRYSDLPFYQKLERCNLCGGQITRARSWCGLDCYDRYMLMSGSPRDAVFTRDQGVCSQCGTDCEALEDAIHGLAAGFNIKSHEPGDPWRYARRLWTVPYDRPLPPCSAAWKALMAELAFDPKHYRRTLWEADHIKPVIEGGESVLGNFQTLCMKCHRKDTKALAGRRSRARRKEKLGGQELLVDLYGEASS